MNLYKPFASVKFLALFLLIGLLGLPSHAQTSLNLAKRQQDFVDLRFGMFIHYNIPTYMNQDWPDPEASPSIFNPKKLNTNQWAKAAKSANMSYGCLTTKHHSGFAIWDTKTTDYSVMNSPYKKDVVKAYTESFRKEGLKVMLYYSILDTHHKIRPGMITSEKVDFIKAQLRELLSNYGKIDAMIIDGWDAPWSRISYDDVPFEEIYLLIKSIQPECLVMDLNAAKYPAEALYYTDIKSYEQGAGQHIEKESNLLPALSCLPINANWFWKTSFPTSPVRTADELVNKMIKPLNDAHCNFILNVAPNTEGLIDDNALAVLKEIGAKWKNDGPTVPFSKTIAPIISSNLAKYQASNSSWSDDMNIMDFANDDDFGSSWSSNPSVKFPWYEITFEKDKAINMIVVAEPKANISAYRLEYNVNGEWKPLLTGNELSRIKIHRFERVWAKKVRILIDKYSSQVQIAEFGIYNERR
ncbi:alpha-L-fucosidase [Pedobacter sp. MW01-1-1]|uniref:alpha-L-fucosidase n=1 Tax=Pedobacter sp. MW01-1-1 TaxID=3383027 RepID=UPI003FEEA0F8